MNTCNYFNKKIRKYKKNHMISQKDFYDNLISEIL